MATAAVTPQSLPAPVYRAPVRTLPVPASRPQPWAIGAMLVDDIDAARRSLDALDACHLLPQIKRDIAWAAVTLRRLLGDATREGEYALGDAAWQMIDQVRGEMDGACDVIDLLTREELCQSAVRAALQLATLLWRGLEEDEA